MWDKLIEKDIQRQPLITLLNTFYQNVLNKTVLNLVSLFRFISLYFQVAVIYYIFFIVIAKLLFSKKNSIYYYEW